MWPILRAGFLIAITVVVIVIFTHAFSIKFEFKYIYSRFIPAELHFEIQNSKFEFRNFKYKSREANINAASVVVKVQPQSRDARGLRLWGHSHQFTPSLPLAYP